MTHSTTRVDIGRNPHKTRLKGNPKENLDLLVIALLAAGEHRTKVQNTLELSSNFRIVLVEDEQPNGRRQHKEIGTQIADRDIPHVEMVSFLQFLTEVQLMTKCTWTDKIFIPS